MRFPGLLSVSKNASVKWPPISEHELLRSIFSSLFYLKSRLWRRFGENTFPILTAAVKLVYALDGKLPSGAAKGGQVQSRA
jgi:hypothetical protein